MQKALLCWVWIIFTLLWAPLALNTCIKSCPTEKHSTAATAATLAGRSWLQGGLSSSKCSVLKTSSSARPTYLRDVSLWTMGKCVSAIQTSRPSAGPVAQAAWVIMGQQRWSQRWGTPDHNHPLQLQVIRSSQFFWRCFNDFWRLSQSSCKMSFVNDMDPVFIEYLGSTASILTIQR